MSNKTYTTCEIDEMVEVIETLGYEVIKRGIHTEYYKKIEEVGHMLIGCEADDLKKHYQFVVSYHEDKENTAVMAYDSDKWFHQDAYEEKTVLKLQDCFGR